VRVLGDGVVEEGGREAVSSRPVTVVGGLGIPT